MKRLFLTGLILGWGIFAWAGGSQELPNPAASAKTDQGPEDNPTDNFAKPDNLPTVDPKVDPKTHGWWNDAVFYEIYTKAFQDSKGDGVGDIKGLISRLDYLNDGNPHSKTSLGVTALWLMPLFAAKSDHGYDTLDYMHINPKYGTDEDFRVLVKECHKRGIKLILDLVMNHTSNEHPWFKAAKNHDSPYRNYYRWAKTPLDKKGPWNETPVWHPTDTDTDERYYYGVFNMSMPDLNLTNPQVTKELYGVIDHWLDEGVDGFRLDAIRYFVEEGGNLADTEGTHAWLRQFYAHYKAKKPDAFTVGEAWVGDIDNLKSYTGDQVDTVFQFPMAQAILQATENSSKYELEGQLSTSWDTFPPNQWSAFLTNHDQTRAMTELNGRVDMAKQCATILLTQPGVPFLYYGEEIGQFGRKPSDDNIRRPMQWTPDQPGMGFTTGKPFGSGFNQPGKEFTVAGEQKDPESLWTRYHDLIALRKENTALSSGKFLPVDTNREQILAYFRYDETGNFLILANLGTRDYKNYAVQLWKGPLKPGTTVIPRGGDAVAAGELNPLTVSPEGGFNAWTPLKTLKAKETVILELK